MKAIILAAGVASRLRPLTNHRPKCLLEIGDKAILQRMIDNLISAGIDDYLIVTGYLSGQIRRFMMRQYPGLSVSYVHNEVYDSTNNIYSLWLAVQDAGNCDFLLLDSDILFESEIVTDLLNSDRADCLALRSRGTFGAEEMKVMVDKSGRVTQISKQLDPADVRGESIGIEKFGVSFASHLRRTLDEIILKQKEVDIFYEAAFQQTIDEGADLYAVDVGERFCMELDTPEDFESAARRLAL